MLDLIEVSNGVFEVVSDPNVLPWGSLLFPVAAKFSPGSAKAGMEAMTNDSSSRHGRFMRLA